MAARCSFVMALLLAARACVQESLLSCLCPTVKSVETRLSSLAESAVPSLLFSLSLARLRVGRWRPSAASGEDGEGGGGDVEALLTTKLTSDPAALRNERKQVGGSSGHGSPQLSLCG